MGNDAWANVPERFPVRENGYRGIDGATVGEWDAASAAFYARRRAENTATPVTFDVAAALAALPRTTPELPGRKACPLCIPTKAPEPFAVSRAGVVAAFTKHLPGRIITTREALNVMHDLGFEVRD